MIKKLIFSFLFVVFCSGFAFSAEARPYVSVKGALSVIESDFDLGYYYGYSQHCGNCYYNNGYYYYGDCCYRDYYDGSTDTVFAGSAALGVKIRNLRFEFEYTHRTQAQQQYDRFPDMRQDFDSVMFNFLYDIPIWTKVYPYAGIGMGGTYVQNEMKFEGLEKKLCFSFAGDLGFTFEVASHLNLDTGVKFTYLGGMPVDGTDYYMYAFDWYCGLRYTI